MAVQRTYVFWLGLILIAPLPGHASPSHGQGLDEGDRHLIVGAFSRGELEQWEKHGFNGETRYTLVEDGGRQVLAARCEDSASGLVRNQIIDLNKTPVLKWSWRVDDIYEDIDETQREGDDYPASLYVAVKTGMTVFSVRALHYVWASNQPQGSSWDSAFTENVIQVALRSGHNAEKGRWYPEARNVKEDFKRFFGLDIDQVDTVSLMSDCDNSDGQGSAYYGDILFSPDDDSLLSLDGLESPEPR